MVLQRVLLLGCGLLLTTGVVRGQIAFDLEVQLSTVGGLDTVDVRIEDFDNDGNADVALLNSDLGISPQWISIFAGDGSGGFAPRVDIPFALNLPWKLVPGDFDGDNDLDFAIFDLLGASATYLRNDGALDFVEVPTLRRYVGVAVSRSRRVRRHPPGPEPDRPVGGGRGELLTVRGERRAHHRPPRCFA